MTRIKDIAQRANVSSSTVSRVLNNDHSLKVTRETRSRVMRAAKELNYTKRVTRTNLHIGIISWNTQIFELENIYYLSMRMGAEKFLAKNGIQYHVFYHQGRMDEELSMYDLDGIIAIGKFSSQDILQFKKFAKYVVVADQDGDLDEVDYVFVDLERVTQKILQLMLQTSRAPIGLLCGVERVKGGQTLLDMRHKTFIRIMKEENLLESLDHIYLGKFSILSGYQMMQDILSKEDYPKRFLMGSDNIALGALRAIQERGLEVPKDISFISIDNIESAAYSNPPLTTMHLPKIELGDCAAKLLLDQIQSHRTYNKRLILTERLVWRESWQRD